MRRFDLLLLGRFAILGFIPPLTFTVVLFVLSDVFEVVEASIHHYVLLFVATASIIAFMYHVTTRHLRFTFALASIIADTSHDGIVITDRKNRIIYANPTVIRSTGYDKDEIVGMTPGNFKSGLHDKDFYDQMWRSIHEEGHWRGEVWDRRKNGDLLPKDLVIRTVQDRRGRIRYHLGIHRDITEIVGLKQDKERLLRTHTETGLPNEKVLRERLEQASSKGAHFWLILTKVTNKSAFMASHDEMSYLQVFKPLSEKLRDQSPTAFYAQIDSEFFVLLVHRGSGEEESFDSVLRNHNKEVRGVIETLTGGALEFVSALVAYPEHGDSTDNLLTAAYVTLEAAIETGEESMVFAPSVKERLEEAQKLSEALTEAVADEGFQVAFQPVMDLKKGTIAGFEALARLPGHSPAQFIPIAERRGLIGAVGDLVRKRAFAAKNDFDRIIGEGCMLALNISVQELIDDAFLQKVMNQCREHDIKPEDILLEITESTYVSNYTTFNKQLHALKHEGFRVAVDDFGTGYSSLAHLHEMSVDILKIDQTFIADLSEKRSIGFIEGILALGKAHDLDIIAEGIEDAEQAKIIKDLGAAYGQGYHFAKPLFREEMIKVLQKKNSPFRGRS